MQNILKLPAYVGIILLVDNGVLLVKRHNTDWGNGEWNFPGGLLEEGETLAAAAVREAREEIGVILDPDLLELVHVIQVQANEKNTKDIFGFYFLATAWQGVPVNNEPDRHTAIGWFSIDEMPESTTAHALQALEGVVGNKRYSEN